MKKLPKKDKRRHSVTTWLNDAELAEFRTKQRPEESESATARRLMMLSRLGILDLRANDESSGNTTGGPFTTPWTVGR